MKKIFKYPYNKETGEVKMPLNAQVLRIEHVSDAFYNCDSVWAVVDPTDKKVDRLLDLPFPYSAAEKLDHPKHYDKIQLSIKEKQTIWMDNPPLWVSEEDGKIFVYTLKDSLIPIGEWKQQEPYSISFYKTGQEIKEDLSTAVYLGIGRLWIIQELCLYVFWTNPK